MATSLCVLRGLPGGPELVSTPTPLSQRTFLPGAGSRRSHGGCRGGCPCAPSPGRCASVTAFIGHRPLSGDRSGGGGTFSQRTPASPSPLGLVSPPKYSSQEAVEGGGPLFV